MTAAKLRLARSMRGQDPLVSLGRIAVELGLPKSTVARNLAESSFSVVTEDPVETRWKEAAVSDPTRRLRVVPPLPGQLMLDLPGLPPPLPPPLQPAPPAPRRTRTAARTGLTAVANGAGPVRRLLPTRPTDPDGPPVAARVPVAVWAVWDEQSSPPDAPDASRGSVGAPWAQAVGAVSRGVGPLRAATAIRGRGLASCRRSRATSVSPMMRLGTQEIHGVTR